jgi:hypothetical protein
MKPDLDVRGLGGGTTGTATEITGLLVAGGDCLALGLPVGTAATTLARALAGALAGVLAETEIGAFVGVVTLALTAGAAVTGFLATGLVLVLLATLAGGLVLAVLATGVIGFLTGLGAGFTIGLGCDLAAVAGDFLAAALPTGLAAALGAGLAGGLLGFAAGLEATFFAGVALDLEVGFFTAADFLTEVFIFCLLADDATPMYKLRSASGVSRLVPGRNRITD